jgi:hypothetical protein
LSNIVNDLKKFSTNGNKYISELDNIIENAEPMEFFTFLLEKNAQIGQFINDLKNREKV